jgi:ABC-type amino acid transport substrate-binding protein
MNEGKGNAQGYGGKDAGCNGHVFCALTRMTFRLGNFVGVGCCVVAAAVASGCGLPRDAEHTIDRVRGGVLRVGVTDRPPWVRLRTDSVTGIEPSLIADLARGLGARTSFRQGSESELLEALHRGELDLVAGGLQDDSPWRAKVALTKPFRTDSSGKGHVLAIRAGENAWLMHVEQYLDTHHVGAAVADGGQQ